MRFRLLQLTAKQFAIFFKNLPRKMPEDFHLQIHYRWIGLGSEKEKRKTISLKKRWLTTEENDVNNRSTVYRSEISEQDGVTIYGTLIKTGFIFFKADESMDVSYDDFAETTLQLTAWNRYYEVVISTVAPIHELWKRDFETLMDAVNKLEQGCRNNNISTAVY